MNNDARSCCGSKKGMGEGTMKKVGQEDLASAVRFFRSNITCAFLYRNPKFTMALYTQQD